MLENLLCYFGIYDVIIGDGSSHAITHVDDTYINNSTIRIKLRNVLLVLALAKKYFIYWTTQCRFYYLGMRDQQCPNEQTMEG